jgi:uncharacterized protein (DUF58 family)
MTITGRFVTLVALGVIPTLLAGRAAGPHFAGMAWWVAALWALGTLILAALDAGIAASPRQVSIQRQLPARARLGESVTSTLTVRNLGRRRMRGLLRDGWQPTAGAATDGADPRIPIRLEAGGGRSVWQQLRPRRRGRLHADLVTIRSAGPMGLAGRQASLRVPGTLTVLPPFRSRRHLPSRLRMLRELEGQATVLVRGQGTEFDSLREYVRGDDVRSIDWRATARRSAAPPGAHGAATGLVVRTWRPERDRRVVIVIDSSRLAAARIDDETRFDTSVEAALLLSVLADRAGDRVDLIAFDRRVRARVAGVRGRALAAAIVEAVADVQPELIEADWDRIPVEVEALGHQHCLVVLLTAVDAPGSSTGLLSILPRLCARHSVVVAAATDPEIASAGRQRRDREEVYRAAAAERALLDIARVSRAVRSLGAEVVTAEASGLPAAVADRYIALKAAGRL